MHYLQVVYDVMCKVHVQPPLNHSTTNTPLHTMLLVPIHSMNISCSTSAYKYVCNTWSNKFLLLWYGCVI